MLLETVLDILKVYPILGYIFVGFLAAIVGSFLNVVIYRIPIMLDFEMAEMIKENSIQVKDNVESAFNLGSGMSLSLPRSRCSSCKKNIPWYYNIPILSYFLLKGKCYNCKDTYSSRYVLVEILNTASWIALYYVFGATLTFAVLALLISLIISMSLIDFDHKILPDSLVFMTYAIGLLFATTGYALINANEAIIQSISAFVVCKLFIDFYSKIRGQLMMGFGDIKIIAAFTAYIGLFNLLYALIIASIAGILYYVIIRLLNKLDEDNTFAFGPFICLGCYSMLLIKLAI